MKGVDKFGLVWYDKLRCADIELNKWINRHIKINDLDMTLRPVDIDDDLAKELLETFEKARKEIIYPYAEKMGNCKVVCLAGAT